jgi:hypothetical protein
MSSSRSLPFPIQRAPPSGVQSGDWAAGGYGVYRDTSYSIPCTLAYPITYGVANIKGILTARHCTEPKMYLFNGHWITFPNPPAFERNVDAYDYAIYETTGLNTDYQIFYREIVANYSEFSSSGWLHATNLIRGYNQVNGMNVCKSGAVTGITCGMITRHTYMYRTG